MPETPTPRGFSESERKALREARNYDFDTHVLILKGAYLTAEPQNWTDMTELDWRQLVCNVRRAA